MSVNVIIRNEGTDALRRYVFSVFEFLDRADGSKERKGYNFDTLEGVALQITSLQEELEKMQECLEAMESAKAQYELENPLPQPE
jgi:hypothetical protein